MECRNVFSTTVVINIIANIQIKNGWKEEIYVNINMLNIFCGSFSYFLALSRVLLLNVQHTDWSLFFNMNPCQNAHLYAKIAIFQTLHGLAI